MAIRDIFKLNRKTFLNPSGWLDIDTLRAQNRTLLDSLKALFIPPTPDREETFEEACVRLNINEADVQEMIKNYRFYAFLYLFFAILAIAYTIYLLIYHRTWTGLLLGFATAALFLSQTFRFDFWAFQLKSRRLGVTFEEWKRQYLG